ncbi:Fic family protein [Alienimonas californiensis]|uniref:Fic family protein n=1 Tax=Alienimonas californiensis TaxID=2527989 RepID=UPI001A99AD98|nr:Fic family protein [Alienimonas californiensis]
MFLPQPTGYRAFIPQPLPPDDPPLEVDGEMQVLQERAATALGRLDAQAGHLPNPDRFVAAFVRKEAVLSSQIEGTQASLDDLLEYESAPARVPAGDATDVVRYVAAMNHGLERLAGGFPLTLRLIREMHAVLLAEGRGSEKTPGEFRRSQNWIGDAGCTLNEARYVPPPPAEMHDALGNLERFLHTPDPVPLLIRCALAHAQFETIHPFLDGNGRTGRLLITFQLCHAGVLSRPLLYLSLFFKTHRAEYYRRLNDVRFAGDWEGWVKFFLRGVADVARRATETAQAILALRTEDDAAVRAAMPRSAANGLRALELAFDRPYLTARAVQEETGFSQPTAKSLLDRLAEAGVLEDRPARSRGRVYVYERYLALLREGTEPLPN